MYKAQAEAAQAGGDPSANAGESAGSDAAEGDNVEDVDFEEVK